MVNVFYTIINSSVQRNTVNVGFTYTCITKKYVIKNDLQM